MPKHLWKKRSFFCSPLGREGWRCNIEARSFLRVRGKSRFAKSSIYCSTEMLLIFFRCVASRRNQADYSAVFRKCRMRHCSRNFIKIAVLALRPGCANRNPNTISACGRVHLKIGFYCELKSSAFMQCGFSRYRQKADTEKASAVEERASLFLCAAGSVVTGNRFDNARF